MTARLNALTVALEQDIRADDAQALMDAIRQLRGVVAVTGSEVTPADWVAYERVRREIGDKLIYVLYPKLVKE